MKKMPELKVLQREELIEIKEILNRWKWPKVLGEKPREWDLLPNYRKPHMGECKTKEDIIRPYMLMLTELLKSKL